MDLKKTKVLILCSVLAISLCACSNNSNHSTENVPTLEATTFDPTVAPSDATPTEIICQTIQSDPLGFKFEFSSDYARMLVVDNTITSEQEDDMNYEKQAFYLNINGINQFLFEIWRIKGSYTENELSDKNPVVTYIGTNKTYTYAMNTIEEVPADLNYEDSRKFKDILNNDVSKIPENFVIL